MASITRRVIKGRTYYYAVESQRINGKPRLVMQKYLGPAERIIDAVDGHKAPLEPKSVRLFSFGGVAAAWMMAQRLRLTEIIDHHAPKREQGISVGQYITLAAVNRCTCPSSKRAFAEWYQDTALSRICPIPAQLLASQRFWDHMTRLNAETISKIEKDITVHMLKQFDLDLRCVAYDATNFFTHISTFNEKSTLAQRGKSKEHRSDLRIIGVALLASMDFHVPLLHNTYAGNSHDSTTFSSLTDELVARYQIFSKHCEKVTLVFDKGNNSQENLQTLDDSPYQIVGSLPYTQYKDLLKIPRSKFRKVRHPRLSDVEVYRTKHTVMGLKRTVLVTYNENLYLSQLQTVTLGLQKRTQKLKQLQTGLRQRANGVITKGKKPTVESVKKQVSTILKGQHMKELLIVNVQSENGHPVLTYRCNRSALERLSRNVLGKTILFTDNHKWSNRDIILAYRGQSHVENAFRTMKDPHFITIRPMHHWTDHMVRVHVFYCILALTISSLLVRELHHKGIDISIHRLFQQLNKIDEVAIVWPRPKRKGVAAYKDSIQLSRMDKEQQKIVRTLKLKNLAAS